MKKLKDLFKKPAKKNLLGKKDPNKKVIGAKAKSTKTKKVPPDLNKKLIAILSGLLVLILIAIAVKMFLFDESDVVEISVVRPLVQTTETLPEPTESNELVNDVDDSVASDLVVEGIQDLNPVVEGVAADTDTEVELQENTEVAAIAMTFDDFVRESENKVYRERNTTPTASE